MKNYLYVIRDDGEYDYKKGFASYKEANDYRQECQRRWINHSDIVILVAEDEFGVASFEVNLTDLPESARNILLAENNIPLK